MAVSPANFVFGFFLFCTTVSLGFMEAGIIIKNVDISSGEVSVNLNEALLVKRKSSLESPSGSDKKIGTSADSMGTKQPSKKQQKFAGYSSMFPEKVNFNLPKLDVNFVHREYGLFVENNIMGIQLKSIKSRSTEDAGESTRLDFQLELSEIHVSVDFVEAFMLISPVRAEAKITLRGLQCNIIMGRLKPWLLLYVSKKKKMVLREEALLL